MAESDLLDFQSGTMTPHTIGEAGCFMVAPRGACLLSLASLSPGDNSTSNVFSISGMFLPLPLPFPLPLPSLSPSPPLPPSFPPSHVLWLSMLQDVFRASPSFPLVLSCQASLNGDT